MQASLYKRLGGEAAVIAAVDLFYEKVLADERTRPFFAALDMNAQVRKQVSFMTRAFGGPSANAGRDLRTAHAALVEQGLNDTHFDAVVEHLEATLRELGVDEALVGEAVKIVATTRSEVLGR